MKDKEKTPNNFNTAIYISKTYGNNVSDEKLINIAKAMNYKPKVFIRNYKDIVEINKLVGSLFNEK